MVYVSPYAHPYVIAGAGTVALEILAQDPQIEVIVCPVGGGGLASGIAIAAGGRAATWGVETEASCPFTRSLAAGRIVAIDVQAVSGRWTGGESRPRDDHVRPGAAARRGHCHGRAKHRSRRTVGQLVAEERLIAEGAAAVAWRALLTGACRSAGRRTAVVLTGANIDPDKLRQLI